MWLYVKYWKVNTSFYWHVTKSKFCFLWKGVTVHTAKIKLCVQKPIVLYQKKQEEMVQ